MLNDTFSPHPMLFEFCSKLVFGMPFRLGIKGLHYYRQIADTVICKIVQHFFFVLRKIEQLSIVTCSEIITANKIKFYNNFQVQIG